MDIRTRRTAEVLKRYRLMRISMDTLPGRIGLLEQRAGEKPAAAAELQRLSRGLELAQQQCSAVDSGMACLTEDEQWVLHRFFIEPEPGCAGILCEELGCEQAQVYRVRQRALQKLTVALYGPEG